MTLSLEQASDFFSEAECDFLFKLPVKHYSIAEGEIVVTPHLSEQGEQLLLETIWGSQGALYKIKNVRSMLENTSMVRFMELHADGVIVGITCFYPKIFEHDNKPYFNLYQSSLAIKADAKNQGHGTVLSRESFKYIDECSRGSYRYVEAGNIYSRRNKEKFDSFTVGTFFAELIFRRKIKKDFSSEKLSDRATMVSLLNDQYRNYQLTDFALSLDCDSYYVVKNTEGRILAGAQIKKMTWQVKRIDGIAGHLLMFLSRKVAAFRKRFPFDDLAFVQVGNIYAPQGNEKVAIDLIHALLNRFDVMMGLLYMDKEGDLYKRLKEGGLFGLVSSLTETEVNIMAKFNGVDFFSKQPFHISIIDP